MGEYYELLKAKKMGAGGGGTEEYNAGKTVPKGTQVTIDSQTYTVGTNAEIFNAYGYNKAVGNNSHAEGVSTYAIGTASHAEGGFNSATGNRSHAEGEYTVAQGTNSHAEGYMTKAQYGNSHAEGSCSEASGDSAHAEGFYTIAGSYYQHVEGRYNVADYNGKYAHIIGNGTGGTRSNALAVDWDGKIYVNNSETGVDVSELNATVTGINNVTYSNLIEYDLEGYIKKVNTRGTWEDNRYTINGVTFVFNADGTVNTFGVTTEFISIYYGSYCLKRKIPYLSLTGCPYEPSEGLHDYYWIETNGRYDYGTGTVFRADVYTYDVSVIIVLSALSFNADGLCFKPMLIPVLKQNVSKAEYIPYAPTTHELMIRNNAIMKGQAAYTTYRYASSKLSSGVTRVTMGSEYHLIDSTYDVVDNGFIYYNATAIPTHELTLENVALYDDIKRTPATTNKIYVGDLKDNGYGVTIRGFVTVSKNGTDTTYYADPMYAKYEEESENRSKEEDEHLKINSRECNAELD